MSDVKDENEVPVSDSPLFKRALAYARGVAASVSEVEITPTLLIAGFYLAHREGEYPEFTEAASDVLQRVEEVYSSLRLMAGDETAPMEAADIPISLPVVSLLDENRADLRGFLTGLLSASVKVDPDETAILDEIVRRASVHCRRNNLVQINAPVFAVAVYRMYLEGALVGKPGLSAHIALNRSSFCVLEEIVGMWATDSDLAQSESLPLSKRLLEAMDRSLSPQARILAALNVGLLRGAAQLARIGTAYHEAGHTVACFVLQPELPIVQVSILSDSGTSGVMRFDRTSPSFTLDDSRDWFLNHLAVMLAGRVAESIKLGAGGVSAGAASDLEGATALAWNFIGRFGLDSEFGPVSLDALQNIKEVRSGWIFSRAQRRLVNLLREAQERSRGVLTENWRYVELIAEKLIRKEVIDMDEVMSLFIETGLRDLPGAVRIRSRHQTRSVVFAKESGVCATLEGPVRYGIGDAIVTGAEGERWPIMREVFDATYESIIAAAVGVDGFYRKKPADRWAMKLRDARRLVLSGGRGVLSASAGDWVVDHGGGDVAVVAEALFDKYYECIDADKTT